MGGAGLGGARGGVGHGGAAIVLTSVLELGQNFFHNKYFGRGGRRGDQPLLPRHPAALMNSEVLERHKAPGASWGGAAGKGGRQGLCRTIVPSRVPSWRMEKDAGFAEYGDIGTRS